MRFTTRFHSRGGGSGSWTSVSLPCTKLRRTGRTRWPISFAHRRHQKRPIAAVRPMSQLLWWNHHHRPCGSNVALCPHRQILLNAILELAVCTFWFNPILRGATRFLREDQELACDAAVLAWRPAARRSYAEALLNTQTVVDVVPIGCGWPSTHRTLTRRLAALGTKPPSRSAEAFGFVVVFCLACSISFAAWPSEERKVAPVRLVALDMDRTEVHGTEGIERGALALNAARSDPRRRLTESRSAPLQRTNGMLNEEHVVRDELDSVQTSRGAEAFDNANDQSNDVRRDIARNFDQRSDEANW